MSVDVFDLQAVIRLETKDYMDKLNATSKQTRSFGDRLKSGFGKAAKVGGAALGVATAAAGVFVKKAVDAGNQFDTSMSQVAATQGRTMDELKQDIQTVDLAWGKFTGNIRDYAQEMGRNTKYTAKESADALNYMALAGYDTKQSMETLPTVMDLASAGAMDLAKASDMVTDTQTALDLSLGDTKTMIDQMATVSTVTNTSVEQLGEAFLKLGATGKNVNGGTKELAQTMGLMASAGIKGTEAGTHMRNILNRLAKPTKASAEAMKDLGVDAFDANGKLRPMKDLFMDLHDSMDKVGSQKEKMGYLSKMFNMYDQAVVKTLMDTSPEKWDEVAASIDKAGGSARRMAETQLDNLTGDVTLFKSAVEGAQIQVKDKLDPALRGFVQFGTKGVQDIANAFAKGGVNDAMSALGNTISTGLTKLVQGLPKAIAAGGSLLKALGKGIVKAAPELTKTILGTVQMLADSLVKGIPEFISGGVELIMALIDGLTEAAPKLIDSVADIVIILAQALIDSAPKLINSAVKLFTSLVKGLIKAIPKIVKAIPKLIKALVNGILKAIPQIIQAGIDLLTSLVKDLPEIIDTIVEAIPEIITGIIDALMNNIDKIIEAGVNLLIALVEDLPKIIATIVKAIPKIIVGIVGALIKGIPKLIAAGLKIAGGIIKGILNFVKKIPEKLVKFIGGIIDYFKSGQVLKDLAAAGKAIINAVWNGMKAIWDTVKGWVKGAIDWIKDAWKSVKGFLDKILGSNAIKEKAEQIMSGMGATQNNDGTWSLKGKPGKYYYNGTEFVKLSTAPGGTVRKTGALISKASRLSTSLTGITQKSVGTQVVDSNQKVIDAIKDLGKIIEENSDTKIMLNNREVGRMVRKYA